MDRFKKSTHYILITKTLNARGLAELFYNKITLRFNTSEKILSDKGTVFISELWYELCKLMGVKKRLSTAFHPQIDGQTER
jgi:hypothetical protein